MSGRALLLTFAPTIIALVWWISKLQWFWRHRPELAFGWLVLLVSGYIAFEAWPKKPAAQFRVSWPVVLTAASGLFLLFIVQVYQAAFGTMAASITGMTLGILLVISSNVLYVFGWPGVRLFSLSLLFLFLAIPWPSVIYNPIVSILQHFVSGMTVVALKVFGIPAHRVDSVIQLPSGTLGINEACSGIRSVQAALMASLFFAELKLQTRLLKTVLIGTGVGLAIFGNVLRSLFLSFSASRHGMVALEKYHDPAGWAILVFSTIGVVVLASGLAKVERTACS